RLGHTGRVLQSALRSRRPATGLVGDAGREHHAGRVRSEAALRAQGTALGRVEASRCRPWRSARHVGGGQGRGSLQGEQASARALSTGVSSHALGSCGLSYADLMSDGPRTPVYASPGGKFSLAGRLEVSRLGFGAMRIVGRGIWG